MKKVSLILILMFVTPGVYSVKIVHPDYKTEYRTIRIPTDSGRLVIEMTKEAVFGVK